MYRKSNPIRKGNGIIRKNRSAFMAGIFHEGAGWPVHLPPVKRGKGPYIYDYDENRYVDFELSKGSLLLGHAPAAICSIMKSWLSKGYASGYSAASHQLLSERMRETLGVGEEDGRWLFYASAYEAGSAVPYLLRRYWKRERGICITGPDSGFSPFSGMAGSSVFPEDVAASSFGASDYVVVRTKKTAESRQV